MNPEPLAAWLAAVIGPIVERAVAKALSAEPRQASTEDTRLLSRTGLATALGVSTATISRWRDDGLPAVVCGSTPRYRLADVRAWVDARQTVERAPREPRPAQAMTLAGVRRCTRAR